CSHNLCAFEPLEHVLAVSAARVIPRDLIFEPLHRRIFGSHGYACEISFPNHSGSHAWNFKFFSCINLGRTARSIPLRAIAMMMFPFLSLSSSSQSTHLLL